MSISIPKQAAESSDGTYRVRTEGLRAHRHAELEVIGVPRPGVEAAAKLIDYVIEVVVERGRSELKAGQSAGFPLSIEGHDVDPVYVGVRAIESEPPAPASGFLAKLRGTAKGVLQLVDLFDAKNGAPLTAVATLMLYRANCRVVTGDVPGAIGELKAAVEMIPGASSAERMPPLDTRNASYNWQNHLAHLRLAELLQGPERAAVLGGAYARYEWLALDQLGATLRELSQVAEGDLAGEARRIIQANLARPLIGAGPHDGLRVVGSPIWTPGPDGKSVRMASLIPAAFADYYYGDRLKAGDVANEVAGIAAACTARFRAEPWRLAELTAGARGLYSAPGAPLAEVAGERHPGHTALSALMAEASRYLRAGASLDEVRSAFGLSTGEAPSESLARKVQALESWETEQYTRALGGGARA